MIMKTLTTVMTLMTMAMDALFCIPVLRVLKHDLHFRRVHAAWADPDFWFTNSLYQRGRRAAAEAGSR